MASYSKSTLSYSDIHQAFEQSGELGSITLTFNSHSAATTWNGRANAYRVLLRNQNEAAGRGHTSPFDHLMVRRKPGSNIVIIEPRGFGFIATGPNGEPLEFSKQTIDGPVRTPEEETLEDRDFSNFLEDFTKEFK